MRLRDWWRASIGKDSPHWSRGTLAGRRCYTTRRRARAFFGSSVREFRRAPDRERDGTATWSLTTLQRALRAAPDGVPTVSTATILQTLWDAGYTWQRSRTWCRTGVVIRKRKVGPVEVTDPDATPKKS